MAIQQTLVGMGGGGGYYEGSGGQSASDVTIGGQLYRVHWFTNVGSHNFTISKKGGPAAVSYTHLRAHET